MNPLDCTNCGKTLKWWEEEFLGELVFCGKCMDYEIDGIDPQELEGNAEEVDVVYEGQIIFVRGILT